MNIEARSYYFDSESGDDGHQVCDAMHPYKSLEKANSLRLNPGDRLLFKRGCTWRGQLHPQGSGAAHAPLSIDHYGKADFPPLIEAAGAESAVYLYNQEYWTITHIAVSNRAVETSVTHNGIAVCGNDAGALHEIRLVDVRVHEIQGSSNSCGILVNVLGDGQPTWFDGVTIDQCRVERVPHTGISLRSEWGTLPGGQKPKSGHSLPFMPLRNAVVSNNFVADAGWSGILVRSAESPVIRRNVVAASNWNLRANGYGVGLWAWHCIDAVMEFNEVYDTREPYCGLNNDSDGNAFNISRNLKCTYRNNFTHDNRGGFMLIDNYCTPSVNNGNIVQDNLSRDDELEFFQFMGAGTTRIINNIFHAGKDLDYKPVPFYSNPAGTPTDYGNIAETTFDILCTGNVFSSEPGGCKEYEIMPGRMDFQWRPEALTVLSGFEGGLDFGGCGWATASDQGAKYLFLDRAGPSAQGSIDFSRHSVRLHAVHLSGDGRVLIASDNAGNQPIECLLSGDNNPQIFATGWRFPAGVVTFSIENPSGARQTKFYLLDYYSNHAFTFAHNYFVNLAPPGDAQREGYIDNFNNQVMAERSGLPTGKARLLQDMLDDAFMLVNPSVAEMPTDAWIASHYPDAATAVVQIDGESVSTLELRLAMESEQPHALEEGLTDEQFRQRSLRRCLREAMLRICAREQGLISHASLLPVLFAIERANQYRSALGLIFGPEILRVDRCLDYYHRNLTIRLRKKLRGILKPTVEQIDAYWEEFHKTATQVFWEMLRTGMAETWPPRADTQTGMVKELIDQNFDRYIQQRVEQYL